MTFIEGEIRWGTGYDNALSFAHPAVLDNQRSYRRPAPGSRRVRNRAGVTDAWIAKRDYVLKGTARHFKPAAWGGLGLQDFLDWASEGSGNSFRFIPDNRYPNFYVDNCVLDEPFDDPEPQIEESDGWQSIDIVIRQQAFDFTLARRGLMFEYAPGKSLTDPSSMVATFSRASIAKRVGRDGILAEAAAASLRDRHFENTYASRVALLERTSTNRCLHSEDSTNAAWTKSNLTADANIAVAPDNAQTADRLTATATGSTELFQTGGAASAGVVYSVSMYVKYVTAPFAWIGDRGDAAYHRAWINLATGAIATQSNCTARVVALANGWYRVEVWFTRTNSGNIQPAFGISDADNGTSCTINRYAYWWGAQDEVGPPTSYIATAGASATRSDDALSFPFTWPLQDVTVYMDVAHLPPFNYNQLLNIGGDSNGLEIYNSASAFFAEIRGSSTVNTSTGSPAAATRYQLCAQFKDFATGPKCRIDVGNGFTSFSSTGDVRTALGANTLRVGDGSNGKARLLSLTSLKVAAGQKTLAEMAAA